MRRGENSVVVDSKKEFHQVALLDVVQTQHQHRRATNEALMIAAAAALVAFDVGTTTTTTLQQYKVIGVYFISSFMANCTFQLSRRRASYYSCYYCVCG